jgi:hypothetical protein
MEVSKYNQMMSYLTRPGFGQGKLVKTGSNKGKFKYEFGKGKTYSVKYATSKPEGQAWLDGKRAKTKISPEGFKKFGKKFKKSELEKGAKVFFEEGKVAFSDYDKLGFKDKQKIQQRLRQGDGVFRKRNITTPFSTTDQNKILKVFPDAVFGPGRKYGFTPGTTEYHAVSDFIRRGFKTAYEKLPAAEIKRIKDRFGDLVDFEKNPGKYGVNSAKNPNLYAQVKNFVDEVKPMIFDGSIRLTEPNGWMMAQMERAIKQGSPDFERIKNKEGKIIGYKDKTKYGKNKIYYGTESVLRKNGVLMSQHPDFKNTSTFLTEAKKVNLPVTNFNSVRGLLPEGYNYKNLKLNDLLGYITKQNTLLSGRDPIVDASNRRLSEVHHSDGVFTRTTGNYQILPRESNIKAGAIAEQIAKGDLSNVPELKSMGAKVVVDGKTYGGGTMKPSIKAVTQYTVENLEKMGQGGIKKMLAALSKNPQCKFKMSGGGRIGFQEGTVSLDFCARDGAKVINEKNIQTPAEQRNFAKLVNSTGGMKNAVKLLGSIGIGGEAVFAGVETLIRSGIYGDTLSEGFRKSIDYLIPGDLTQGAQVDKINRVLKDPDLGEAYRKYDVFKDNVAKLGSLEAAKAESEAVLDDNPFSVTAVPGGMKDYLAQQQKLIDEQKQKVDKTFINPEQELVAQQAFDEGEDVARATAFGTRIKKFATDLGEVKTDESGLNIDLEMLPDQNKTAEFGQFRDLMLTDDKKIASEIQNALQLGFYGNPVLESSFKKANDQYQMIVGGFKKAREAPLSELVTRGVASAEEVYGTQGANVLKKIDQATTNKSESMFDSLSNEATGFSPQTNLISNQYDRESIGTGLLPFSAAGGGIAKLAGKSSGRPPESGPTPQGPQGLDFLIKRGRQS